MPRLGFGPDRDGLCRCGHLRVEHEDFVGACLIDDCLCDDFDNDPDGEES